MTGGSRRPNSLDRPLARVVDWGVFALLWAWLLLSMLYTSMLAGVAWLGVVLFLVGLGLCWQAIGAKTHPTWTIGTRRSVDRARIDEAGHDCDECGAPAGGGEWRRYATRTVLFGTTVAVPEWGENVYCPSCLEGPELEDTHSRSDTDLGQREQAGLEADRS